MDSFPRLVAFWLFAPTLFLAGFVTAGFALAGARFGVARFGVADFVVARFAVAARVGFVVFFPGPSVGAAGADAVSCTGAGF